MQLLQAIHQFLIKNGFEKTAKKFLQEANIKSENVDFDLQILYDLYKKQSQGKSVSDSSSSSSSDSFSSSDSSTDSDSDSELEASKTEVNSDSETELNTVVTGKKTDSSSSSESDSDSSSSSESDSDSSSSSESDSDSSSSSESDSDSSSSSESDSDSSSSSESDNDEKPKVVAKPEIPAEKQSSSDSSSSSGDSESSDSSSSDSEKENDAKIIPIEKQVITPVVGDKRKREESVTPSKLSKTEQSIENRFQRVKRDEVEFLNDTLKDNTFMTAIGENNYGYKAHQDLIVTRGKGFRKEKDKKKRGSYRGGAIDFQTRSFKFPE